MRRPSIHNLACSCVLATGLWLSAAPAGAQVPRPPAGADQQTSFVVDSNARGTVPPAAGPTPPVRDLAVVTTIKVRKAGRKTSAVPTTIQVRVLDASALPAAAGNLAAPAAPAAVAVDGSIPDSVWAALRKCESGGSYTVNSGNGYYGAYQFAGATWRKLGYPGLPHEANPATQDEAARKLQSQQGWAPWPSCTRRLGLR